MNTFAILLLCAQACLVQNVYSQCLGGAAFAPAIGGCGRSAYALEAGLAGPAAFAPAIGGCGRSAYALEAGLAGPAAFAYPAAAGLAGAYGGEGIGDVAIAGEMGVAGTTLVAGQVPIMGAVRFGGDLPAAGAVTISGSCGCGCGRGGYLF